MKAKVSLYAPKEYWELTAIEKEKICNGCGAKGSWFSKLIPQQPFKEACNIHDFMYFVGRTTEDKEIADQVFLVNMWAIVEAHSRRKWLLKIQLKLFFRGIKSLGEVYFWRNKTFTGSFEKRDV